VNQSESLNDLIRSANEFICRSADDLIRNVVCF